MGSDFERLDVHSATNQATNSLPHRLTMERDGEIIPPERTVLATPIDNI